MGNPFSKSNRVEPLLAQEDRANQNPPQRLTIRQRLLCLDRRVAPVIERQIAVRPAEVCSAAFTTPSNAKDLIKTTSLPPVHCKLVNRR